MKTIKLTTTRGNVATMNVDIARFTSKEAFLTEYVERYNKAFSGISKERIEKALLDAWYLKHPSEAPPAPEAESEVPVDPPASKKKAKEAAE